MHVAPSTSSAIASGTQFSGWELVRNDLSRHLICLSILESIGVKIHSLKEALDGMDVWRLNGVGKKSALKMIIQAP